MKKIKLSAVSALFEKIGETRNLYVPTKCGPSVEFKKYGTGELTYEYVNTGRSVKDFYFPQSENLVDFKMKGKSIEIVPSVDESLDEKYVVFGVRACDAKSSQLLDRVFLADPVDTYYKTRRENGIIVTLACTKPSETCFCTAFGIDPTEPAGDASAWIAGDYLYIECLTEKAEALAAAIDAVCENADAEELTETKESTKKILEKLPLANVPLDKISEKELKELFYSEKWKSMSEACLGCGTCTFVCPTCQCYDIREFNTGDGIKRFRCWDSCMYSDFTKMAHGNPRTSQVERFRQRFMHKLVYYPANNEGIFGCVGCGRCVAACPVSKNIAGVIRELAKGEDKQ
jgi:heterodisulfide reductase subunit C